MKRIANLVAISLLAGTSAWMCPFVATAETLYYTNQTGGDIGNISADLSVAQFGHNSVKKWEMEFATNSGQSLCVDISTDGAAGGDTFFYVNELPINDDVGYPNYYSRARAWLVPLAPPAYANLTIQIYGYNSSYNDMKFNVIFRKIAATTESQCWNSMPGVSNVQGTMHFSPQALCKTNGQC